MRACFVIAFGHCLCGRSPIPLSLWHLALSGRFSAQNVTNFTISFSLAPPFVPSVLPSWVFARVCRRILVSTFLLVFFLNFFFVFCCPLCWTQIENLSGVSQQCRIIYIVLDNISLYVFVYVCVCKLRLESFLFSPIN